MASTADLQASLRYAVSLTDYRRRPTREVMVGKVGIGGSNPIRIQSMTTVDTMDTAGSIAQSIRMIEAGCELVRITAPSLKEAANLQAIKNGLRARGYDTPLVADIHFTPNAAELAARIVEKVRVNPGNYADKKKFDHIEYTDLAYEAELARIRQKFTPLVRICKEHGTAMRIGTNHGSLSDRILSRYGDTPLGMVESALEFLRICEDERYYDCIISMKASNPQVMVQAYRLLVAKLDEEGLQPYPLHLGVTEAGEGEDGRVKSAVGIGALLEDGLGDTIRVSLTEEPELEAPVAKALAMRYEELPRHPDSGLDEPAVWPIDPYHYHRRDTRQVNNIGGHQVPRVMADLSGKKEITPASLFGWGLQYSVPLDKWNIGDQAVDYIFTGGLPVDFEIPGTLGVVQFYPVWHRMQNRPRHYPWLTVGQYLGVEQLHPELNFIYCTWLELTPELITKLKTDPTAVLMLDTYSDHGMAEQRRLIVELMNNDCPVPVIIGRAYGPEGAGVMGQPGIQDATADRLLALQLHASTDVGALLLDGLGDGIFLCAEDEEDTDPKLHVPSRFINSLAFGILQATRTRISKTEYISCPSCGRTLFDLQETTARIRARTEHLKGVKIGIMGCIVNGPGEMADADYGYVGVGVDKIALYRGQNVVRKAVPTAQAVDALIDIIKEDGVWVERAE